MKKKSLFLIPLVLLLAAVHFHDGRAFKRELIHYDDVEFIAPLQEVAGWGAYFKDRVLAKDAYAFPLRDLSFWADFKLSKAFGFNTFWFTNFLLFTGVLFLLFRLYQRLFPRPQWGLALITLLALHPTSVEMIQWASNRKHLLVALILAWGTVRVWDLYQSPSRPALKHWAEYFGYYILAWLCWPSAALWIYWPQVLFFKRMNPKERALVLGSALLISGLGVRWTMTQNTSYDQSGAAIQFWEVFHLALQSVGRGAFNTLFPFKIAPYYSINSPANIAGLALLAAAALGLLSLVKKRVLSWSWHSPSAQFLILGVLLFAPNALVFLGYYEFVWADRYLYTPLPYLVAAVALFFSSQQKKSPPNSAPLILGVAAGLMLISYTVLSWGMAPSWHSERALFDRCAQVEKSPKCIYLAVEKNFDQNGCQDLGPHFMQARKIAPRAAKADFGFSSQLPLYEAICIVQQRPTVKQRLDELESLKKVYTVPESLAVGEVWAHVQNRDLDAAFRTAMETYLKRNRKFSDVSPKIINIIRGQMEALCELGGDPVCPVELQDLQRRTQQSESNPAQPNWAKSRTIEAYFTGR